MTASTLLPDSPALRGAAAGAVAAGAWLAVQPVIRQLTGSHFDDARLLGRMITAGRRWRLAGTLAHLANGAVFGAAFSRLERRTVLRGILAAEAENVVLWPSFLVADRIHPDRRNGHWAPLTTTPAIIAHEVLAHLVFGAVLGALTRNR